jgi:ribonuclease D
VNLPHHKYIAASQEWQVCLNQLQSEPRLAIDLEANSMFAYRERVCLIQISIPAKDFIIDPLAQLDLSGLGLLLASPDVEKVFHAAEYDLTLLKRQYGWELHNLFDTMWAARILGYPRYGLADLLKEHYQAKLNKRYQKSNWCNRPLSLAQRVYAQLDTHYLLSLRDQLAAELEDAGCWEEAEETFVAQTHVKLNQHEFTPDSIWSIQGVHDLNPQQQAVLRELAIYRDSEARQRNRPHFKVFNNRTLVDLAQFMPGNLNQLRQIHGMTRGQVSRHGRRLLQLVETGMSAPPPSPPRREKRPPEMILNRYDRLYKWRKNRAQARGVESDVVMSRDALWAIATANPRTGADLARIEELGAWRSQTYGQEILKVLRPK